MEGLTLHKLQDRTVCSGLIEEGEAHVLQHRAHRRQSTHT